MKQEPVLELTAPEEEEEKLVAEEKPQDEKKDLKIQRTVVQEVPVTSNKEEKETPATTTAQTPSSTDVRQVEVDEEKPDTVPEEKKPSSPKIIRRMSRQNDVNVVADEPQPSRRSPSPARNPVSNIIHVRNLVRPYTLGQLKDVLGRTGTLVEEGFWIDKIKSHCYVTYENEEHAKATRQAIHGTRWPSSNPKVLRVEYATLDELDFHKSGDVTPASIKRQVRQDVSKPPQEAEVPVREPKPEKKEGRPRQDSIREWDRDKMRQSRSRSRERRDSDRRRSDDRSREKSREQDKKKRERSKERKEKKEKKEEVEEAPAKLLDDLFCKTKAVPCIYWLPLTEEQAVLRDQKRKADEEKRERLRKERMQKEEDARRQREKEREERIRQRPPPNRAGDKDRDRDRGRTDRDKDRGNDRRSRDRDRNRRSRSRSRGAPNRRR